MLVTRAGHVPVAGSDSKWQWEAVVVERGLRHIWLQYTGGGLHVTSLRALLDDEHVTEPGSAGASRAWRLDRGPSTVTFDRMSYALQVFAGQKLSSHVTVRAEETPIAYSSVFQTVLMDLDAPAEITRLASAQPGLWGNVPLQTPRDIDHVIPEWRTWQLNDSQRSVISHVINRRLSLIQGPPGACHRLTRVTDGCL